MSKARVEAFSDGVIAVAITLLALDLHVPDPSAPGSLAHRLAEQWPNYAAYVVSFLTIGIIWINHHAMLRRLVGVDHAILVLNLVLLMTIGVLPFSTALMAEYLKAAHGENLAALIYAGSFLAMAISFFVMQRYMLTAKQHLLHERLTPVVRRAVLLRNASGLPPYAVAMLAAILSPYLTLAICAAVAVFYALPSTTADVNQHATDPQSESQPRA
ncbi:MAG: TMEM175 family protein [Solirubrobacteraceae bacterium]